ncbi:MAG: SRPBCC family protein [Alphaproteobacteria bacterium]|nr:SRPBCC family protein [Alphaproteobacteria bacterium]
MEASTNATLAPVVKRIAVPCSCERAFELFTAGIANWWPLSTHSVGRDNAACCMIEPRSGGRIFETGKDGTEHDWGKVLAWEPPHRLAFTWHPGGEADSAQTVEVTFTRDGAGAVLTLEHRDWHRLGERAPKVRKSYDQGWDAVLDHYRAAA